MRKIRTILIIVAIVCVISMLPKNTKPSPKTRLVLDHTYHTYIAPPCFQQADATNYLQDSHLKEAREFDYDPHDQCTIDALAPVKDRLFISVLKDIGLLKKKWDRW